MGFREFIHVYWKSLAVGARILASSLVGRAQFQIRVLVMMWCLIFEENLS